MKNRKAVSLTDKETIKAIEEFDSYQYLLDQIRTKHELVERCVLYCIRNGIITKIKEKQ